jgi:hypothetical protein
MLYERASQANNSKALLVAYASGSSHCRPAHRGSRQVCAVVRTVGLLKWMSVLEAMMVFRMNVETQTARAQVVRARPGWMWFTGAIVLLAYRLIAFLPPEVNSFAASHYLFSYTAGFHKRGLPGAVLGLAFQQVSAVTIYVLSLCMLGVMTVALLLVLYDRLRASAAMLVLCLVVLGAPGALPHFAYALGYFDPILIICSLLALLVLKSSLADPVKVAAAFVPCAVGVLTHESFVLTAFPLIGACTFAVGNDRKGAFWTLTGLVLVLTALVQAVGQPSIPLEEYVAAARSRTHMGLDVEAFRLLYFNTGENLSYLRHHYSSVATIIRIFLGVAAAIPYFVLLRDLFRKAVWAQGLSAGRYRAVCAFILVPPSLLLLAGFDVLRWVSFASLNCSILVLECNSSAARQALDQYVKSPRFMILALMSFALGALHVVDSNTVGSGVHSIARGLGIIQW